MFFFVVESRIFFHYSRGISDLTQILCVRLILFLGTKKISVIACGQTSSMALSDAGEVGVKKDETRKCFI